MGLCCGDALGAAHWTCEQVHRKDFTAVPEGLPPWHCSGWGQSGGQAGVLARPASSILTAHGPFPPVFGARDSNLFYPKAFHSVPVARSANSMTATRPSGPTSLSWGPQHTWMTKEGHI